jgi:LysM repeat protein
MQKFWLLIHFGFSVMLLNAQPLVHTVKSGETLYAIAKMYSLTLNDLLKANFELKANTSIKTGQRIVIPSTNVSGTISNVPAKVHTVTRGETAYALCKKYGITIAELKQWNNLSNLNLIIGQKVIVSKTNRQGAYQPVAVPSTPDTPYKEEDIRPRGAEIKPAIAFEQKEIFEKPREMPLAEQKTIVNTGLKTNSANAAEYPDIFNQYGANGYKIKKSRGAASCFTENTTGNQHLAFYNHAETGSIIRVTNLLNKQTIFVKVMGKVPPADVAKDIMLKLTHSAAALLNVADDKFLVEVSYYTANP